MVRGGTFPKHTQSTRPITAHCAADQSEDSVLFRMRGFIETGSKQELLTDWEERSRNNGEYEENNQHSSWKSMILLS